MIHSQTEQSNHRICSKCLPECSTQNCKRDNQEETVALWVVSRGISFQASVKFHFNAINIDDDCFTNELRVSSRYSNP